MTDKALDLALSVGEDFLRIFEPFHKLDEQCAQLEAKIGESLANSSTARRIVGEKVDTIRLELWTMVEAFSIWKGLHLDLVRKFEDPGNPDPRGVSWIAISLVTFANTKSILAKMEVIAGMLARFGK